jgi:predicted amidohydrolase YtcJ
MRVYAMLGEQEIPVLEGDLFEYFSKHRLENYGDHFLSVRSIKLFFDGALGSRGAAFFEPYEDDPGNTGLLRITPEYITDVTRAALRADMGVCTHCIGIRGNRLCLESYGTALEENPKQDHRLRIEHAQIVRDEDIEMFKDLGVIPAMQPTHCTSDMPFVEDRVGSKRAEGAYAWRSFLDAGMVIPCGSDFPVESNNPLLGIYAAVTRQDVEGYPEDGWFPEQRMTREEAVKGFTIWAAYGAFQEDILGSIEVGKLADFTILDKDILSIEPKEILTTDVLYTIVGGKIVYEKD